MGTPRRIKKAVAEHEGRIASDLRFKKPKKDSEEQLGINPVYIYVVLGLLIFSVFAGIVGSLV